MKEEIEIKGIGNTYGGLTIKSDHGYFWSIAGYAGECWQKIPKELFDALKKFQSFKKEK